MFRDCLEELTGFLVLDRSVEAVPGAHDVRVHVPDAPRILDEGVSRLRALSTPGGKALSPAEKVLFRDAQGNRLCRVHPLDLEDRNQRPVLPEVHIDTHPAGFQEGALDALVPEVFEGPEIPTHLSHEVRVQAVALLEEQFAANELFLGVDMEPVQRPPGEIGRQVVLEAENVQMDNSNFTDLGVRMVTPDSIAGCAFRLLGPTVGDSQAKEDHA